PPAPSAPGAPPVATSARPGSIAPRPAVPTWRPRQRAKAVRHHRPQPVRQPAKAPPVSSWLAPLRRVVAAAGLPVPAADNRDHPYLWLGGIALAVLAVAGLSLHMLTMRYFDLSFE